MIEKDWMDYLTAFGSIGTPIVVMILAGIGWKFRNSIERKIDLENKLRADRIEIYNTILKPFTILLMNPDAWNYDKRNRNKDKDEIAKTMLLSLEYRDAASKLSLVANDNVVMAYSKMMQFFYSQNNTQDAPSVDPIVMISLFGKLLLEVRRGMGNELTKLDEWQMLEWCISDIHKIKNQ